VPLRSAPLASGPAVARCGTCTCADLGGAGGSWAAADGAAGDSADVVATGGPGGDTSGSDRAGWNGAGRDEADGGRTGRGCADLGEANQDGSDWAGVGWAGTDWAGEAADVSGCSAGAGTRTAVRRILTGRGATRGAASPALTAASSAVSVWPAVAFLAFLGRAFGGCLCHTRAVTKMSSFSANGAIRHQARGSAT